MDRAESKAISEEGVKRIKEKQSQESTLGGRKDANGLESKLPKIIGLIAIVGVIVIVVVLFLSRRKGGTASARGLKTANASGTGYPRDSSSIITPIQQTDQTPGALKQIPIASTNHTPVPRFCPYCGTPRLENAEFCARCGKRLSADQGQ